ncbi:hypothetical protein EVA_17545 [gut metagenome]|uniref:Uncharacterized protein n=1 Tax=gut metagenome TaxID=749906 RepID=J9FXR9_9ZZZZ
MSNRKMRTDRFFFLIKVLPQIKYSSIFSGEGLILKSSITVYKTS